jgi:hypothetical protein
LLLLLLPRCNNRRYLAALCNDPLAADKHKGPTAKLQPASLAGNVLYTSPLSARSMSLSGRGKLADKGTVYTTRVSCFGCLLYVQGLV